LIHEIVHPNIDAAIKKGAIRKFFGFGKITRDKGNSHLLLVEDLFLNVPVRQGFPLGVTFEADCTFHI
jgi:hypothetical protein